jgi:hypothetical protein
MLMKIPFLAALKFVLFISLVIFSGCDSSNESFETNKNSLTIDLGGDLVYDRVSSLVIDETNPLNKYSRVDSVTVYGFGFDYFHPDSLKNCDLKLIITGKIRETESITGNIACSVENTKDSLIFWRMLEAKNYVAEPNKWVSFTDSILIPATSNPANAKKIKLFSSKGLGKGFFDVDNIKIEIKQN